MPFLNYLKKDIGIDLGTTNSLVYLKKRGIIINEPTVVAINTKSGQVLAIGNEAKKMLGRTPAHINVIKPLINGVVSDFEMTQEILRHFFKKINQNSFFNYNRLVIGIPTNLTEVERKSVEDAAMAAGANKVFLIEEPIAAVLGARLPANEPVANMIVDIGGGTTEIAIISLDGIVIAKSLKIAGDKFDEDIIKYIRDEFKLIIGEPTAEELKVTIGSAIPLDEKLELAVRGRDISTGLPKEVIVKHGQIRIALNNSISSIVDAIREIIELTPPELVGDILKQGIHICGGGSLLKGIEQRIEKEVGVSAIVIEDPLTCVVRGTGIIAENFSAYTKNFSSPLKPIDIKL